MQGANRVLYKPSFILIFSTPHLVDDINFKTESNSGLVVGQAH